LTLISFAALLQPVQWKTRLEMVIRMKNEILIGIFRYLIESTELELELELES